jgi:hypothetical protein
MLTLARDVIDAGERARLRAALDAAGWRATSIADRFHLETASLADPLIERLAALAHDVSGPPPTLLRWRWLRLRHGDYQLTKGDAHERPPEEHIEIIADLSATATGEAEILYSDGRTLPQLPGAVAIVARAPSVLRWQRYLTHRVGDAAVYRLLVTLLSDSPSL